VFTPRKILALEPSVRALTAALLRDLKPRGGCEFMSEFSLQMPIIVFMQLMNLPLEDRLELLDIAGRIVRPPAAGEQRDDALKSLFRYLAPIIGERRQHPGADMISTLSRAERAGGGHLTAEEVQGMTATLLIGGLDTVAASLGWFIRYLADNPAQRRRLIDEPGLIRAAAEELFRRFPVTTTGRNLTGDHEFGGLTFRRNDHVVWAAAMYNLDDRIFPNPMEVDFGRRRGTYLSLGHGPHFCLGATLAQLEFRIFLEEWLKHIPEFQVSAEQQAKYRSAMIIAYQSLPLVWAA
jgi:cytochrome P450